MIYAYVQHMNKLASTPVSWVIEDLCPFGLCHRALLTDGSGDITDDVHSSSCGTRTGHKFWATQCFITSGTGNVTQLHIEVTHLVDNHTLQIYEHTILLGTQLVFHPTCRTFFCKANLIFIACLDIFGIATPQ